MKSEASKFICPECGSCEAGGTAMVSTEYNAADAWSAVLQRVTCAECHFTIPAHLAHRWNGLTVEQAKQEWQETYRATAREENN